VDDTLNARCLCSRTEIASRLPIVFFKGSSGTHRVDQVIGHADSPQCGSETGLVQYIASNDLGAATNFRFQKLRSSSQTADAVSLLFQHSQQSTTNIAGRSS